MKTMARALELADNETKAGRNVMVLAPDISWTGKTTSTLRSESRGTIHIRCANLHAGLKSVAIDTLILVGSTDPAWDVEGENYAHKRLKTSTKPKVVILGDR